MFHVKHSTEGKKMDIKNNILYQVYTATEAAVMWGLHESTVRKAILAGKFVENVEYRKAGSVSLVTYQAMVNHYGPRKEK